MSGRTRGPAGRALLALFVTAPALLFVTPGDAEAQVRRGRTEPPTPPWAPIAIGVRGGWEQEQLASGSMLGVEVRLPVVRSGRFEVVPSFDAIFINPQTEYQYNVDVVFVPGGRRGGVYAGGGVAWRESLVAGAGRSTGTDTYTGLNIVLGGKNRFGPLQALLGIRFTILPDSSYDPSVVGLGLSLPLWSGQPQGQAGRR